MYQTITDTQTFVVEHCCSCGVAFAMPFSLQQQRLVDGNDFFCPNGHSQYYTETEAKKLKRKLKEIESQLATKEFELTVTLEAQRSAERRNKRLQKRIANGVCPCCHRQFIQMTRHMRTQHPDYIAGTEQVA